MYHTNKYSVFQKVELLLVKAVLENANKKERKTWAVFLQSLNQDQQHMF